MAQTVGGVFRVHVWKQWQGAA